MSTASDVEAWNWHIVMSTVLYWPKQVTRSALTQGVGKMGWIFSWEGLQSHLIKCEYTREEGAVKDWGQPNGRN